MDCAGCEDFSCCIGLKSILHITEVRWLVGWKSTALVQYGNVGSA